MSYLWLFPDVEVADHSAGQVQRVGVVLRVVVGHARRPEKGGNTTGY